MEKNIVEITIKNLRLRTIIGINEWERKTIQDVIVSISYKYDASKAIKTDDLDHAINYKVLIKKIINAIQNSEFHLLESLTDMIYNMVADENPNLFDIDVSVEKPFALRFCDTVICKCYDDQKNEE